MPIGLVTRLAWRNLWRRPRRTIIMVVAIALGIWSMIALGAVVRGMLEGQIDKEIFNLTGHIQIHAPGFTDDPVVDNSMPAASPALGAVLDQAAVAWAERVRVPAVVASERESTGVSLLGIDPTQERGLSFIGDGVHQGRELTSITDRGIVVGRKLLERLETDLGKRVVVMSQDRANEVADRGFRIVGVFHAEMEAVEEGFAFVGRSVAQDLLKMHDQISEIGVLAHDRDDLDELLTTLGTRAPELDVQSWRELKPLLVLTNKIVDVMLYIWFVVVFMAMSFGLVNTLLMAVYERTREIGLLQALGMRPTLILGQVSMETLFLLLVGAVFGNLCVWATLLWFADGIDVSRFAQGVQMFNMSPIMQPLATLQDIVAANLIVLGLGLIASLYPAWRASRYVPVEAITRT